MNARFLIAILSTAALAIPAGAQNQRRATMVGGGNAAGGHCTGQVVVDGSADLQIQGDTASVRDVSGSQPQVQRFECTSAIPPRADLRVNVNGRGHAQVVQSSANGGPEVIRIEDREGGASVYQFDVSWGQVGANPGYNTQGYNNPAYNQGYGNPGYGNPGYAPPAVERRDSDRAYNGYGYNGGSRFTTAQAVNVCRDAVREQAMEQFGARSVNFDSIRMDDNPGRHDWVVGRVDMRRGAGREEYPFSCSVNFDTGRVRSAQINAPNQGYAARDSEARAMDTCRSAVIGRIGGNVNIGDMNVDPDGDLVRGSAWSRGRGFDFSCRVSPYSGNVRDLTVTRRR
jgi:hypothetical protein